MSSNRLVVWRTNTGALEYYFIYIYTDLSEIWQDEVPTINHKSNYVAYKYEVQLISFIYFIKYHIIKVSDNQINWQQHWAMASNISVIF